MNPFIELKRELEKPATQTPPLLDEEQIEKLNQDLHEVKQREMRALNLRGSQIVGHEVF